MKRKALLTVLLTSVLMLLGAVSVYGDSLPTTEWKDYAAEHFADGTGHPQNPFRIETAEQLALLYEGVAAGESYNDCYFRLEKDIDLSGHIWNPIGVYMNEYNGRKEMKFFEGTFDGNGKTITGMIVDQRKDRYAGGLFGACRTASYDNRIYDLTIKDAQIYGCSDNLNRGYNGILVGYLWTSGGKNYELNNITVSGTIYMDGKEPEHAVNGGLIGYAFGATVKNCKVEDIAISGSGQLCKNGGFVGMDYGSSYENCTVAGTVTASDIVGGFVGYSNKNTNPDPAQKGSFKNCLADVKVDATGWCIGGFAGYCEDAEIRNCAAKGDVATTEKWNSKVGSFVGDAENITIEKSHGAGIASSGSDDFKAGGFLGYNQNATVSGCSFDSERNKDLKGIGGENPVDHEGITGTTTQGVKINICKDYAGRHNPVKVAKKAATCTEDGTEEYYICEACGTMYSDADQKNIIDKTTVIKAEGHKFGDWKVTKQPTTKAEGEETKTCENCPEKETRSIAKLPPEKRKIASVAFSKKAYIYNGKTKKPAMKVKDADGKVIPSKDYTVKYPAGRKKVGTYTVTVTLKTGAKNTVKATFRIVPKTTQIRSLKKGGGAFTVKWFRKGPQVTGYQVQYSTSKNFTKAKTKRIKGYYSNTKKVKKLGKKKTYYVRVRTYKKIGKTTYYAVWSKAKRVTTK